MELDSDVHRAFSLQEAGRTVPVVGDFGVAGVVHDGDIVGLGELNRLTEIVEVRYCARRIVRVVEPQQLGLARNIIWNRVEIGQPVVLFGKRQHVALAAREQRAHGVNGISRIGHQCNVSGVEEAKCDVTNALLCANE